jgi:membrane-associated phospholipid phosphatase
LPDPHLTSPNPPAEQRREHALFAGLAAVYALALGLLFALGHFGFIWKTLVIPSLFVVAALARRFRGFVRDWSVFLGAIILFDSCRGIIFSAIHQLDLPVYMGYAITAERALFGGLPSLTLQRLLFADGQIGTLERALVAVHASHFVAFLGFALLVWLIRTEWFPRLVLSFVLVMGLGIAGYLLIPTIPPWMASEHFQVLPDIVHMSSRVYNISLPAVSRAFDINPIAAMPSLHAAFPMLLTLLSFRLFRQWGVVMLAYCLVVVFAIVYMGEHYVVDVIAGVALAVVGYVAAFHWRPVKPWLDRLGRIATGPAVHGALLRPLALTALLLALAMLLGLAAENYSGRFLPTEGFIAHELEGKTPLAGYYRALRARESKDFQTAQSLLAGVLPSIRDSAVRVRARLELAESAFHNGDFAAAVSAFDGAGRLTPVQVQMKARANAELARPDRGVAGSPDR